MTFVGGNTYIEIEKKEKVAFEKEKRFFANLDFLKEFAGSCFLVY